MAGIRKKTARRIIRVNCDFASPSSDIKIYTYGKCECCREYDYYMKNHNFDRVIHREVPESENKSKMFIESFL